MDSRTRAENIIAHGAKNDDSPARIAKHLDDYGLLMPDLPEPKEIDHRAYRWNSTHTRATYDIRSGAAEEVEAPGGVTAYVDHEGNSEIWLDTDHGEQLLTPAEALALALALLAAAHYAGGNGIQRSCPACRTGRSPLRRGQ